MNYYKRHIGDYMKDASHLSLLEHGVYMRLLDVYYTREAPIPVDQAARLISARSKDEREALSVVADEFFTVVDGCYTQTRCDAEIAAMQQKAETNRAIGMRGGRPKKETQTVDSGNPKITQTVSGNNPDVTLATSHKPITNTPSNEGVARTPEAEACLAMKAAGMASVNPSSPKLTALLDAGITLAELASAAADATEKGKPFAYALALAEGRRRDAVTAPLPSARAATNQNKHAAAAATIYDGVWDHE